MPAAAAVTALVAGAVPALALTGATGSGPLALARDAAPVVMTGAQIAQWAAPAAQGLAKTYPSGTNQEAGSSEPGQFYDPVRTAHNGTIEVPPTPPSVTQVLPQDVVAYSWTGSGWREIPVQVDERFPYFLANGHSGFSFYSGTDEELTYAWAPDRHDTGEESWKKMFGDCTSRFASSTAEVDDAVRKGWLSLGPQETAADYLASMRDPQPWFDTDDELSFMASDAGGQAPTGTALPDAQDAQVVTVADPLDPASTRFVYLGVREGGSSYDAKNGYVRMTRDADSLVWLDKDSFARGAYDGIGTSNTGYGPNLPGTVCRTAANNPDGVSTANGVPRDSKDRQPRDDFTVTTPTYREHTTGRWLVQGLQVRKPDSNGWSPNIIARWKGRAFQQSPDSDVSLVGFEDEQVNWEMNSALLGWRQGPVRAIREIWGADSGTNVTKTETYYRDADVYGYKLRVHPIPPDGLYTDWAYRPGVATTYYNLARPGGVAVDGQEDTSLNEVDQLPTGQNAYLNTCDPKTTVCSAVDNPEEVAGDGFGLVYSFELTSPTGAVGNAAVVPYYRDDACFDDGTGDAPAPRPWPGEASSDPRVQDGYVTYWQRYWDNHPQWQTFPRPSSYADLKCRPQLAVGGDPTRNPTTPPWQIMPFSGAIGEHGIHFFATQDSDNATLPKNVDEVDGQQWRFLVPMRTPTNVLTAYGPNVSAKLVAVAAPYSG
jgi:hypothetical protein